MTMASKGWSSIPLARQPVFFVRLSVRPSHGRAKYLTIVDFFERRYNKLTTVLTVVAEMLTYFSWTAAQIVAGGAIAQGIFGVEPVIGMVIIIVIVAGYTMMGGLMADTMLDFFQMFLTSIGLTMVFIFMLKAVGGFPGLIEGRVPPMSQSPLRCYPSRVKVTWATPAPPAGCTGWQPGWPSASAQSPPRT